MAATSTSVSLPSHLELVQSSEDIEVVLDRLAVEVEEWARVCMERDGRMLLMVCVLRGGAFFFSDLLQRIGYSVEPAFCRAWSYSKDVTARPEESVRIDWPEVNMAGRDVILVDNICDTGRTFACATAEAWEREPASVRTVSFVKRKQDKVVHEPTLSGVSFIGREWLVGYGLRDRGTTMMNARLIARAKDTENSGFTMNNSSSPFTRPAFS